MLGIFKGYTWSCECEVLCADGVWSFDQGDIKPYVVKSKGGERMLELVQIKNTGDSYTLSTVYINPGHLTLIEHRDTAMLCVKAKLI